MRSARRLAFFVNLLWFSWAMGLMIAALVLRLGLGAESLAWALIFLIQPLSGVYYPIATCRRGCSRSPGACPRRRCSRACARFCSTASCAPTSCSPPCC